MSRNPFESEFNIIHLSSIKRGIGRFLERMTNNNTFQLNVGCERNHSANSESISRHGWLVNVEKQNISSREMHRRRETTTRNRPEIPAVASSTPRPFNPATRERKQFTVKMSEPITKDATQRIIDPRWCLRWNSFHRNQISPEPVSTLSRDRYDNASDATVTFSFSIVAFDSSRAKSEHRVYANDTLMQ